MFLFKRWYVVRHTEVDAHWMTVVTSSHTWTCRAVFTGKFTKSGLHALASLAGVINMFSNIKQWPGMANIDNSTTTGNTILYWSKLNGDEYYHRTAATTHQQWMLIANSHSAQVIKLHKTKQTHFKMINKLVTIGLVLASNSTSHWESIPPSWRK